MSQPGETSEAGQTSAAEKTIAEKLKERFLIAESFDPQAIEFAARNVKQWILDISHWKDHCNISVCYYEIDGSDEVNIGNRNAKKQFMNALQILSAEHGISLKAPCLDRGKIWFRRKDRTGWTDKAYVCEFMFEFESEN